MVPDSFEKVNSANLELRKQIHECKKANDSFLIENANLKSKISELAEEQKSKMSLNTNIFKSDIVMLNKKPLGEMYVELEEVKEEH